MQSKNSQTIKFGINVTSMADESQIESIRLQISELRSFGGTFSDIADQLERGIQIAREVLLIRERFRNATDIITKNKLSYDLEELSNSVAEIISQTYELIINSQSEYSIVSRAEALKYRIIPVLGFYVDIAMTDFESIDVLEPSSLLTLKNRISEETIALILNTMIKIKKYFSQQAILIKGTSSEIPDIEAGVSLGDFSGQIFLEKTKEINLDLKSYILKSVDRQDLETVNQVLSSSETRTNILRFLSEAGFSGGTIIGNSINLIFIPAYSNSLKTFSEWEKELTLVFQKIIEYLYMALNINNESRLDNLQEFTRSIILVRLDNPEINMTRNEISALSEKIQSNLL